LWNEKDQHDHDLLKHHDEDVESTLTCPGAALNWLTYIKTLEIEQHFKTLVLNQGIPANFLKKI